MSQVSNEKVLSTVLKRSSYPYASDILSGTEPLVAMEKYTLAYNQFVEDLVNVIGLQRVRHFMFENTLAKFKKGDLPLGNTLEDIYVGLCESDEFDPVFDPQKEFGTSKPDIEVCYHKVNSERTYKVSISDEQVKSAFNTPNGLADLVSAIVSSPVNTNEYHEFLLTKETLVDNLPNTYVVPIVMGPDYAKSLLKAIKKYSGRIKFAKSEFNRYCTLQAVKKEYQELILSVDANTDIDVDALAPIFNLDKASITTKVSEVDDLPNGLLGWLIDGRALQIMNHIIKSATTYVGSTMTTNIFYHVHQLYGFSLFGTNIAFADSTKFIPLQKDPSNNAPGNTFEIANEGGKAYPGSMVVVKTLPGKAVTSIQYKTDKNEFKDVEKGRFTFTMPTENEDHSTLQNVTIKVTYAE